MGDKMMEFYNGKYGYMFWSMMVGVYIVLVVLTYAEGSTWGFVGNLFLLWANFIFMWEHPIRKGE